MGTHFATGNLVLAISATVFSSVALIWGDLDVLRHSVPIMVISGINFFGFIIEE